MELYFCFFDGELHVNSDHDGDSAEDEDQKGPIQRKIYKNVAGIEVAEMESFGMVSKFLERRGKRISLKLLTIFKR